MKTLKQRTQWKRYMEKKLINMLSEPDLDLSEIAFIRAIDRVYYDPIMTQTCKKLLDKYNEVVDLKQRLKAKNLIKYIRY